MTILSSQGPHKACPTQHSLYDPLSRKDRRCDCDTIVSSSLGHRRGRRERSRARNESPKVKEKIVECLVHVTCSEWSRLEMWIQWAGKMDLQGSIKVNSRGVVHKEWNTKRNQRCGKGIKAGGM